MIAIFRGQLTLDGALFGSHEGNFSEVIGSFPFEVVTTSSLTAAWSGVDSESDELDSVESALCKGATL